MRTNDSVIELECIVILKFFFQADDSNRFLVRSSRLGYVYKRQGAEGENVIKGAEGQRGKGSKGQRVKGSSKGQMVKGSMEKRANGRKGQQRVSKAWH